MDIRPENSRGKCAVLRLRTLVKKGKGLRYGAVWNSFTRMAVAAVDAVWVLERFEILFRMDVRLRSFGMMSEVQVFD
eukprot:267025-Amorphochlora_amoeboformis.AAC.1